MAKFSPKQNIAFSQSVARTKLAMPSVKSDILVRDSLEEVGALLQHNLTIVCAPGGYGKTTTMVRWAAKLEDLNISTAWLSCDERDVDAPRFLAYIATTFIQVGGSISDRVLDILNKEESDVTISLQDILNAFLDYKKPLVFFFDDLHLLEHNGTVFKVLEQLTRAKPDNVHFVISSRERPSALIGRSMTQLEILEYSINDFRLGRDEISSFLELSGITGTDAKSLKSIETASEGWIAGLKSAVASAQGDLSKLIELFSNGNANVNEFFAHDILERQPESIQNFLLDTSVMRQFSAELAAHVTNNKDAENIISELQNLGLFIFSIDDQNEWFRYHHLFSDFLIQCLRKRAPDRENQLHKRASKWNSKHGHFEDAYYHALEGGDIKKAGQLLDDKCTDLFHSGRTTPLLSMAEQLPTHVMREFPRLLLTKAWTLALQWYSSEASRLVHLAEEGVQQLRSENSTPRKGEETTELGHMLLTVKMICARFDDQLHQTRAYCDKLLNLSDFDNRVVLTVIYDTLIHVETDQFDFSKIEFYTREINLLLADRQDIYMRIWHQASIGRARLLQGETTQAIESCKQGMKAAVEFGLDVDTNASMPGLILAEIHYHRGEIDHARTLCSEYSAAANEIGFPEKLISILFVQARILQIEGQHKEAFEILARGMREGQARHFERLILIMAHEQLVLALRQGHLAQARQIYASHNVGEDFASISPGNKVDRIREVQALIWVRFAMAEGRLVEARRAARRWRDFTRNTDAKLSFIQWSILLAQSRFRDGDTLGAIREIRPALRDAQQGQFVRLFLDEGQNITDLLRQIANSVSPLEEGRFAKGILSYQGVNNDTNDLSLRTQSEALGDEALGGIKARELEVLKCLAAGLTNRQIGDTMGMTEGTVKWYLQKIYDELGVRKRKLAIEKARQLGLLS
ncbi:MAG: LuxR C-terminal-related transcriptional regulator [Pseudomonadota bacterium]